jgi:hypothetical protein
LAATLRHLCYSNPSDNAAYQELTAPHPLHSLYSNKY